MAKIKVHEQFTHDSSGFPEGFEQHNIYLAGVEYEVPDDVADYFIRTGWAALPGEEPVKPDPSKPVFVQPDSSGVGTNSTSPGE